MAFKDDYDRLVCDFKAQVKKDDPCGARSVFLPNIPPKDPVDFVLIATEPSLAGQSIEQFSKWIDCGFKNFAYSMGDFILHFCVREYLCRGEETYYITDLAKGAMAVRNANSRPQDRYEEWYCLLQKELALVENPGARRIPIGKGAGGFLRKKGLCSLDEPIPHYSQRSSGNFGKAIQGREDCYHAFAKGVTFDDIMCTVQKVLNDAKMESFKDKTLPRLRRGRGLTDYRKKLMFDYKVAFEAIRKARTTG